MTDTIVDILQITEFPHAVDVGSSLVDGPPPYAALSDRGWCRVTGFEPNRAACNELAARRPHEKHRPVALGDGAKHKIRLCRAPGMNSLLEPDPDGLALFPSFPEFGEVLATEKVATHKLDDEVDNVDYLKLDVQGSELMVLSYAQRALAQATVVQVEVSFSPLYRDQPLFADLDVFLRGHGFMLHDFAAIKRWPMAPGFPPRQLLEADAVYIKRAAVWDALSAAALKKLALIMYGVYRCADIPWRIISALEQRGDLPAGCVARYIALLVQEEKSRATQSLSAVIPGFRRG